MKVNQIPSVKYRDRIKSLMSNLPSLENFGGLAIAIVLKSGRSIWLSNRPEISLSTFINGLYRGDLLLAPTFIKDHQVIFPNEFIDADFVQSSINQILVKHQLYRCYCYVRACDDCYIVVSVNTNIRIEKVLF